MDKEAEELYAMTPGDKQEKTEFLPRLVAWEITRSCVLSCAHCRAAAERGPYENELSTAECMRVLDEIASVSKPILILTGGEALLREDVYDIAKRGDKLGLRVVLASCGTVINRENALRMKDAGVRRVSISLDGSDSVSHDRFRGVAGAFEGALRGIEFLRTAGIEFQVNTTVTRRNVHELKGILDLAIRLGACAFHPFLLVPTGRGKELVEEELDAFQYEEVLGWVYEQSLVAPISVKPTCAPHYHRIVRQREANARRREKNETHAVPFADSAGPSEKPGGSERPLTQGEAGRGEKPVHPGTAHDLHSLTRGCMGGSSFCFISHVGEVQMCGFLEQSAGNVRNSSFAEIWKNSPFFGSLRNFNGYHGKCGYCEFRKVCGGCRARAFAITADYLGEEPFCYHTPSV